MDLDSLLKGGKEREAEITAWMFNKAFVPAQNKIVTSVVLLLAATVTNCDQENTVKGFYPSS